MIAKTGALILGIIVLSFVMALLLLDLASEGGFTSGSSLASFFNFLSGKEKRECDCEYSTQLGEYICNPSCGELAGKSCKEKADCLGY
jgi:hypothetical protein